MAHLVTGEAVVLDLRPAALPSRIVAGMLDAAIQAVVLFGVGALVAATSASGSGARSAAVTIVAVIAVLVGYPVAFESLTRGRTPGKAAMGLRVVRDDGGPIGFRQAFVRGLVGFAVERPGLTLFSAAVITSLLNPRGKRLGDLLAGTVVLQERVAVRSGPVAMMPPGLAAWATTLDLGGVTDELALSARQFIARAAQLTPAAREQVGGRLVASVAARTSPPPPPGTPGWAYLSAVLAERRRREQARRPVPVPVPVPLPVPLPAPVSWPAPTLPAAEPPPATERQPDRPPAGGFAPPA